MDKQDRSHSVPSWQELLAIGLAVVSLIMKFAGGIWSGEYFGISALLAIVWSLAGLTYLVNPFEKHANLAIACAIYACLFLPAMWIYASGYGAMGFVLGVALAYYIGKK